MNIEIEWKDTLIKRKNLLSMDNAEFRKYLKKYLDENTEVSDSFGSERLRLIIQWNEWLINIYDMFIQSDDRMSDDYNKFMTNFMNS